jgi:hypothetical protein
MWEIAAGALEAVRQIVRGSNDNTIPDFAARYV